MGWRRTSARLLVRTAVPAFGIAALASCASGDDAANSTEHSAATAVGATGDDEVSLDGVNFEVRRDPGCGCCTSWVEYLQRHGATVELTEDAERASFRSDLGITDQAASCHTAVVDGYAVEGHVPISAIRPLLDKRPDAVGLALPGMPIDSPGMGGDAAAWEQLPVMLVNADGSMSEFDY